jgi:hypothetical protein
MGGKMYVFILSCRHPCSSPLLSSPLCLVFLLPPLVVFKPDRTSLPVPGQTYEGGVSASPGFEAHGAYAFCALGCLAIIDSPHRTIPK